MATHQNTAGVLPSAVPAVPQKKTEKKKNAVRSRCCLRAHHAGGHLFVKTRSTMVLLGDCQATPESVAAAIAEIDAAYPLVLEPELACPNCGETGGEPGEIWEEPELGLGGEYRECCSLCKGGSR